MVLRLSFKLDLALSFIFALVVANISGPQYIYPTYGSALNDHFGWTAVENSIVSTACFIGISFSGPLCAWMLESLGTTTTLRVSSILLFLGPFLVAQTYAGRLPDSFILCAVYLAFTGIGGAAAFLCALDSQSQNFKSSRGLSMGLTTASVGVCGVVFSQINDFLFTSETDTISNTYRFLMFLSIITASGVMIGSFFLGPIQQDEPIYEQIFPSKQIRYDHVNTSDLSVLGESDDDICYEKDREPTERTEWDDNNTVIGMENHEITGTAISGTALLLHPIGFSLFVTLFIVIGIGYVYLANISQLLHAISDEASQHERNLHITLFSLGNCGSRILFGALSDQMKNKYGIHRIWVFVYAVISLLLVLLYIVYNTEMTLQNLKLCTVIVSMSYGILFGVGPTVTTEFGIHVFARNWGLLLYAPAFGSQIFNLLFGILYGREAERQGSHVCHGPSCYNGTFYVAIFWNLIALGILSSAIYRTGLHRPRQIIDQKFQ
ncbi:major facilitator superfamily domain-containing protein [Choanephora cucurbitarum]|nr:major facilitator superfamily domain-containing protein [Choanephora cucurbitarum]